MGRAFTRAYSSTEQALSILPLANRRVRQGKTFAVSHQFTIPEGETRAMRLVCGDEGATVVRSVSSVSGPKIVTELREAPTSTTGITSAKTPINVNRELNLPSDSEVFVSSANASVTGGFTLSGPVELPGATGIGQTRTGSTGMDESEWLLAPGKEYVRTFTNTNTESATVYFELRWYQGLGTE